MSLGPAPAMTIGGSAGNTYAAEESAVGKCAREHRQSQHRHHDEETATPARARDIIVIMIGAVSSANCDGLDICVVMVIGRGGQEYCIRSQSRGPFISVR